MADYILWFDQLGMHDVNYCGGQERVTRRDDQQSCQCRCERPRRFCHHHRAYRDFLHAI